MACLGTYQPSESSLIVSLLGEVGTFLGTADFRVPWVFWMVLRGLSLLVQFGAALEGFWGPTVSQSGGLLNHSELF